MGIALVDWTGWSPSAIVAFEPRWRELAIGDFALCGRAAGMSAPSRRGALTAKFALGGTERYHTTDAVLDADDDGWVVMGEGERYASHIAPGCPVATISLFFAPSSIAAARDARRADPGRLLDDPCRTSTADEPLPVGRRRLAYGSELATAVVAVALEGDVGGLAELHALALELVLDATEDALRERSRVLAVRLSTRAEVHRRVARAHDYLMTAYAGRIDLTDLARIAAMAPHHFLRAFRAIFGLTPHRALIERRIAVATRQLRVTDQPVGAIARSVGFATLAAFSARFRRETGRSPCQERRDARRGTPEGCVPRPPY